MSNRARRETRAMLESLGCTDIQHETGKHTKWRFKTPAGNPAVTTTSITTSDHRATLNTRAVVRSTIREKDGSQ